MNIDANISVIKSYINSTMGSVRLHSLLCSDKVLSLEIDKNNINVSNINYLQLFRDAKSIDEPKAFLEKCRSIVDKKVKEVEKWQR